MRLMCVVVVLFALGGCLAHPSAASRGRLISRLQNCLTEVGKGGDRDFTSPCAKLDVQALVGMGRDELQSALGTPTICMAPDSSRGNFKNPKCPRDWIVGWSFYTLPPHTLGGGPELMCFPGREQQCERVAWSLSQ